MLLLALASAPGDARGSWYSRAHGKSVWAGVLYPERGAPTGNESTLPSRRAAVLRNASLPTVFPRNASLLELESHSSRLQKRANKTVGEMTQLAFINRTAPPSPSSSPVELCSWWVACGRTRESVGRWAVPLGLGGFLLGAAVVAGELNRRTASSGRLPQTAKDAAAVDSRSGTRPPRKARIGWFDNVKLFAIIGVAINHAIDFAPRALMRGTPSVFVDDAFSSLDGIGQWAVEPTMPIFFLVAGAVSSPELSSTLFLRSATGLLLPAVLVGGLKAIFLDVSFLDWRVGVPFVAQASRLGGALYSMLTCEDYCAPAASRAHGP